MSYQRNDNNLNLRAKLSYFQKKLSIKWSKVPLSDSTPNQISDSEFDNDFNDEYLNLEMAESYSSSSLHVDDFILQNCLPQNLVQGIANLQFKLCQQSDNLKYKIKIQIEEWNKNLLALSTLPLDDSIELLERNKILLKILYAELRDLQINKETVELSKPGHKCKEMKDIEMVLNGTKIILSLLSEFNDRQRELEAIEERIFVDFDDNIIQRKFCKITENFNVPRQYIEIFQPMKDAILYKADFVGKLLKFVSNCHFVFQNKTYWDQLMAKINLSDKPINILNLKEFYSHLLNKGGDIDLIISNFVDIIHAEKCLWEQLSEIENQWNNKEFKLIEITKENLAVISNYDNIFDDCIETLNVLSAIKLSSNAKKFLLKIAEMERLSQNIYSFVTNLRLCQQFVIQYTDMFSFINKGVNLTLPADTVLFENTLYAQQSIMIKIKECRKIIEIINITAVKSTVIDILKQFDCIRSSINSLLENQRKKFGRFYFIGNNDLIELIGCSPHRIQQHIEKIYPSIKSIHFVENTDDSFVVNSVETFTNEILTFHQPIQSSRSSEISDIFMSIEANLHITISTEVTENLTHFMNDGLEKLCHLSVDTLNWIGDTFSQSLLVLLQILWTSVVETAIVNNGLLTTFEIYSQILSNLSRKYFPSNIESKMTMLLYEIYQQQSVILALKENKVTSIYDPIWLEKLRFYYVEDKVMIKIGFLDLQYRYEIYGCSGSNGIIRTPLIDHCFLSITEASRLHLGSLLFGPAGTGKTESIKQLAKYLGRHILVFNCGETFTEESIARILKGASKIGAWICFDEFNRLTPQKMHITFDFMEKIQRRLQPATGGIMNNVMEPLFEEDVFIHEDTLILLTMNKAYKGRFELPAQVHDLFRSFAMTEPDVEEIIRVLLHIQGFQYSNYIGSKLLLFFKYCMEQIIKNIRYDFGIRTLKAVLISAGRILKEKSIGQISFTEEMEERCVIDAINVNIKPRLSIYDGEMIDEFIGEIFPSCNLFSIDDDNTTLLFTLKELYSNFSSYYTSKIVQFALLLNSYKSVIVHGCSGCGKTFLWQSLIHILNQSVPSPNIEGFLINPNTISQDNLYGAFDKSTSEWKDGLLSGIFRSLQPSFDSDVYGDLIKPTQLWIIFDGSVSQSWIENLNSLFDDNETLTLANGERLRLPKDMKVIIETDSLLNVTPSTISRCGILHIEDVSKSDDTLLYSLASQIRGILQCQLTNIYSKTDKFVEEVITKIFSFVTNIDCLKKILQLSEDLNSHIMKFQRLRSGKILLENIKDKIGEILDNCRERKNEMDIIIERYMVQCSMTATGSDCDESDWCHISAILSQIFPNGVPKNHVDKVLNLNEFWLGNDAEWRTFHQMSKEVSGHDNISFSQTNSTKVIISTKDTVRIETYLEYAMKVKIPVVFCGPPGSGKSMAIIRYFSKLPSTTLVTYNFNCDTTPNDIVAQFDLHCRYELFPSSSTRLGISTQNLIPKSNRANRLVFFFDEINLQKLDQDNIQQTSLFLRDIFEKRKFFHNVKHSEIIVPDNVLFVAACNPANSGKRINLSHRLLRHTLIVFVDHPSKESLCRIYGDILQRGMASMGLSQIMPLERLILDSVNIFTIVFQYLSSMKYNHYLCTLRDFSRWIFTFLNSLTTKSRNMNDILKVWTIIGLHVFGDRLVDEKDRVFLCTTYKNVLKGWDKNLEGCVDTLSYMLRLDSNLEVVDDCSLYYLEALRPRIKEKVGDLCVCTDQVLDNLLRLLMCVTNKGGSHNVILIGDEGSGRECLCDLLSIVSHTLLIKISPYAAYNISDFEDELKKAVRLVVLENRSVIVMVKCNSFISADIIEKASPLFAQGSVDNIFEEKEYEVLMDKARDFNGHTMVADSDRLSVILQEKLKFILILSSDMFNNNDQIVNSTAILNRCHVTWLGGWNDRSFHEATQSCLAELKVQLNTNEQWRSSEMLSHLSQLTDTIEQLLITCHKFAAQQLTKDSYCNTPINIQVPITDCHYLKFLKIFHKLFLDTFSQPMERCMRLKDGCNILNETMEEIRKLEGSFEEKQKKTEHLENDSLHKLHILNDRRSTAEKAEKQYQQSHEDLRNQENLLFKKRKELNEKIKKQEQELIEAESCLRNLQRKEIFEIKTMKHPPKAVKLACEAICDLLNETVDNWNDVLGVLLKENFVSKIFNFNWKNVTEHKKQEIFRKYLTNPDYTARNVSKASVAMGVIVKWTIAQFNYAHTMDKIIPLKNDSESLDKENDIKRNLMANCKANLRKIRKAIDIDEKDNLILRKKIDAFQKEIMTINIKLSMARQLTNTLGEQYSSWTDALKRQKENDKLLIVDIILSSALLCYARHISMNQKNAMLKKLYTLSMTHLSTGSQYKSVTQLFAALDLEETFQISRLFEYDKACHSNNGMIQNCPLIIDPSNTFMDGLKSEKPIVVTSFSDANFLNILKSTVLSDCTILIKDAELFNPIVIPLIRQRSRSIATLINIKGQSIKVAPNFRIILFSKSEKWIIPVELSINCTVTCVTDDFHKLKQFLSELILDKEYPDRNWLLTKSPEKDYSRNESIIAEKENILIDFLLKNKNDLLSCQDNIQIIHDLKLNLSIAVDVKHKQLEIIDRANWIIEKYELIFETLEQLLVLLAHMEEWCSAFKFPTSAVQKCLAEFIEMTDLKLISNVSKLCSNLLQKAFGYFVSTMRIADHTPFAINLCYIQRETVEKGLDKREHQLWMTLKHCLSVDEHSMFDYNNKIKLLTKYLSAPLFDESIFGTEMFKTWTVSFPSLLDLSLIINHLPPLTDIEGAIFLCIIANMYHPNHLERSLNQLVYSILKIDIGPVTQYSSSEYLRECLLTKSSYFEPILILTEKPTNTYSLLNSIKPSDYKLRRLSFSDLKKGTNYEEKFENLAKGPYWIVVTNWDAFVTEGEWSEDTVSKTMPTNEILSLFSSIFVKDNNCKFIFVGTINSIISQSLFEMSKIVIIESGVGYKACLERNLGLLLIVDGLQQNFENIINLLIFHSLLQVKSELTAEVFHTDNLFNDTDFLCAANIVRLSFEQEKSRFFDKSICEHGRETSHCSEKLSICGESQLYLVDVSNMEHIKVNTNRIKKQLKWFIIKSIYCTRVNRDIGFETFDNLFDEVFGMNNTKTPNQRSIGGGKIIMPETLQSDLLLDLTKDYSETFNTTNDGEHFSRNRVQMLKNKFRKSLFRSEINHSPYNATIHASSTDKIFDQTYQQQRYFLSKYDPQLSLSTGGFTNRFISREIQFGCQLLGEVLKYKRDANADVQDLEAERTREELAKNILPVIFRNLFSNMLLTFEDWSQEIVLRIKYLMTRQDGNLKNVIDLDRLFHPTMFFNSTKLETSRQMIIPLDDLHLYLLYPNKVKQPLFWSCSFFKQNLNMTEAFKKREKINLDIFWSDQRPKDTNVCGVMRLYQYSDGQDLIVEGTLIVDNGENQCPIQDKENVYFVSNYPSQ